MTHSLSSYFIKFDDYINNVRKYVYIQLYHYIKNIQFSVKREVFAYRVTIICLT